MHSLFGTDGIRDNVSSVVFSPASLQALGNAIGSWASQRYGYRPTLIMGYDTRYSAHNIKKYLLEGLNNVPVDMLDAHIIPTPAAAHLLNITPHAAAAIIISASHNSAEYNGIKLFDKKTGKLSLQDEMEITNLYHASRAAQATMAGCTLPFDHACERYIHHVYTEIAQTSFSHASLLDCHVVIDAAHGATSHIASHVFEKYGAKVTMINDMPDGYNINKNSGSTSPYALQKKVIQEKADIGFAFDGDGDRVIAVNRNGEIKNGDDLLCMLLNHPDYKHTRSLVGTIMTNGGLEAHLAQKNIRLLRTPVGDRFISAVLAKENLLLGGEPVGHIILFNHLYTGDGLLVALKILETLIITNNWDMNTFDHYAQASHTIPVQKKHNLLEEPLASIIQDTQRKLPNGRILVRYSGTEPILRIAVETHLLSQAQQECDTLKENLYNILKDL